MFQKIIDYSIKNKLVVGIMTLALIVWGVVSLSQLPFDSTPDITNNQVQVITQAPTLGAQEVEQYVTTPLEMSFANIPDIIERRSISRSGLSVVTLVFRDNVDIYWARQQVSQQMKEAEEQIPSGAGKVSLAPISTGLGEIYQYTIHPKKGYEKKFTLTDIRTVQDWIVRKQFAGTEGVAEVNGWGGYVKQYEVAINSDRLASFGLTVSDLYNAIEKNNKNTGGSYIEQGNNQYFIRGIGLARTLEDIRQIPVKTVNSIPVHVSDVADVRFGTSMRYGAVTRNGEGEVVSGITLMLKGENFQQVMKNVKARMAQIQKTLPKGLVIEPFIDRTQLVDRVTATISRNLVEGLLIVMFILVLFLGNARAGLIVASVIPLSMLFAFGMMKAFGVGGNLMSLGALDFGIIVDGAVIIVECVSSYVATHGVKFGRKRLSQADMDKVVTHSAGKMMSSAAFGEIIIMTVYVPLFTLVGIEGKMFRPMAMTVFFAVLGAFILSLTYVPVASSLFLSKKVNHKENFSDRMMHAIQRFYYPIVRISLKHCKTIIVSGVALLALSLLIFSRMGGEFIPNLEEGDLCAELSMKQGTSLTKMIESATAAEKILKKRFPEVKQVVTRIGSSEIPTDPMPMERADMMISLKPKDEWTSAKTQAELSDKMEEAMSKVDGLNIEMSQPIQMRTNELVTGVKQDVAINIYGNNIDSLASISKHVAKIIHDVDGVGTPVVERVSGLPQLQVIYDRARLSAYGISIDDANNTLQSAFAGATAGSIFEEDKRFDIVLRLNKEIRDNVETLQNLLLTVPDGSTVPLSQVAEIKYVSAPSQITHDEGQRRIYVGFNVRGRDVESTISDIEKKLDAELKLPVGYHYTYGGQFENLKEAKSKLSVAVPIALVIILFLLFFTLRSLREVFIVFTEIPLAAIGGIMALWLRGMPFSISAGVGFIALFGVVVLNGIVLINQFDEFERHGISDINRRILNGCMLRLRPVLMTALVASLGFLPMAISTGDGAEVQRPLATVVIGGLIISTILTLVVLPAIYKLYSKKKQTTMKRIIIIALAIIGISQSMMAQERRMTLNEILKLAMEHNLGLQSSRMAVERASALQGTAFSPDPTSISISQDPTSGGSPDNAITVSQNIALPSVYSAHKSLLKAQTNVERSRLAVDENELRREVSSAFYDLLYAHDVLNIYSRQSSIYNDFNRVAVAKFSAGETGRLERMNAERLKRENEIKSKNAERDFRTAQLNLMKWLNTDTLIIPIDSIEDKALFSSDPFIESPLLMLAKADVDVANRQLKLEKKGYLPTFSIGASVQAVIKGFNPYNIDRRAYSKGDFMGFSIGVNIPLAFGAQKARMNAARKTVDMASLNAKNQEYMLRKAYEAAYNDYISAHNSLEYYQTQGVPQAREMERISKISYENGSIGYVELMQNMQSAVDVWKEYADAERRYNKTIVELNYLKGDKK